MKVVVIGAGATGLASAFLLRRAGHEVTIVEAAPRPGGLLATFDIGAGARLEYFYHHFFTHDTEIHWLLSELGLAEQVTYRKTQMGMFRAGSLYPFNGLRELLMFRAISPVARMRFGLSTAMLAYLPGYADAEHVATLPWMDRWAGRAATDAIWRPLMQSKFGDAADRVPLAWMAGRLRQRMRSRKSGDEQLGYLHGSLQVLVDRLSAWLTERGVVIHLGSPVEKLVMSAGRIAGVQTSSDSISGDVVLATTPTTTLAALVEPFDADYAARLRRIRYLGAICVVLALRAPLSRYYWLNVADPGQDFGGVIEHTNLVGPVHYNGQHLVYFSRYVDHGHPMWSMPDTELLNRCLTQAERLYGRPIRGDVVQSWVHRSQFAAPCPELGFHELIPSFRSPLAGLGIAGMCHVYPDERSVNNCVRVAAEAVRALGDSKTADVVPRGLSLSGKYGPRESDQIE